MALEKELLKKVEQIRVWKPTYSVDIDNPTSYKLLGAGKQGVAFQIDQKRCVKMYFRQESLTRELHALQLGGKAGICPEVFLWGDHYIVMEYLNAPTLYEYLDSHPLTEALSGKIIQLLDTFENIGFNRFDHAARHIYMLPGEHLKVIDVVHVIKSQPVWLAQKLISDMEENAILFVEHVKTLSPKWYERWSKQPEFAVLMEKLKQKW